MGQTVNLLFRLRWFESTLSHQKKALAIASVFFSEIRSSGTSEISSM